MSNPLLKIDVQELLRSQQFQRYGELTISGTIPASGSSLLSVNVDDSAHFYCTSVTGRFSTKNGAALDTGICYLRGQLKDGANTPLWDSLIPLDLWLTPGRVKSLAASGDASNPMYLPQKVNHLFSAGSTIFLDMRNDGAYENFVSVAFWGIRISKNRPPLRG